MASTLERHANAKDAWPVSEKDNRTYRSSYNGMVLNGINAFNEGMWYQKATIINYTFKAKFARAHFEFETLNTQIVDCGRTGGGQVTAVGAKPSQTSGRAKELGSCRGTK